MPCRDCPARHLVNREINVANALNLYRSLRFSLGAGSIPFKAIDEECASVLNTPDLSVERAGPSRTSAQGWRLGSLPRRTFAGLAGGCRSDPCSAVATNAPNWSMDKSTHISGSCNFAGSSVETEDISLLCHVAGSTIIASDSKLLFEKLAIWIVLMRFASILTLPRKEPSRAWHANAPSRHRQLLLR